MSGKVTVASLQQMMSSIFDEVNVHKQTTTVFHKQTTTVLGSAAGPSEAERDKGLTLLIELRRHIMNLFPNYQQAYDAFGASSPSEGIAFADWEAAMPTFDFTDAQSWMLVFGFIIDFQHVKWEPFVPWSVNAIVCVPTLSGNGPHNKHAACPLVSGSNYRATQHAELYPCRVVGRCV